MLVNLKKIILVFVLIGTLSGCGVIEVVETPESWGARGGRYGAEEWIKNNGRDQFPSSDSAALYCVSIVESGRDKFNWNFQQTIESTNACTEAFVEGLK